MENFSEKKLLVVKYFGDVLNLAIEFLVFSSILAADFSRKNLLHENGDTVR